MKTINYIFLLVIFFLVSCNFSTPKESGCNCLSNNELKLTAINDNWTCGHDCYYSGIYEGTYDTTGKRLSSDIWTPPIEGKYPHHKVIVYCDSFLLEEIDVYYSPCLYNTIDGPVSEILYIRYDYYMHEWRCTYLHAIKLVSKRYKGLYCFTTDYITKEAADSIADSWLNIELYNTPQYLDQRLK